jgi:hypothetical protein
MIDRKQIVNSQCSFSQATVTGAARPVTGGLFQCRRALPSLTSIGSRWTLGPPAGSPPLENLGFFKLTPESLARSDSESPPCQTVTNPPGPGGGPGGANDGPYPRWQFRVRRSSLSESPAAGAAAGRRRITGSTMPRRARPAGTKMTAHTRPRACPPPGGPGSPSRDPACSPGSSRRPRSDSALSPTGSQADMVARRTWRAAPALVCRADVAAASYPRAIRGGRRGS